MLGLSTRFLIFTTAIYLFSYVTADPDLWGHIKFGGDHLRAGELAERDPYSFTAYGSQWINHEWLAELIFYAIYRFLGDTGLLFGKLTIGLCLVWILLRICNMRRQYPLTLAFGMILAIYTAKKGFMVRPQLFSFLFFSLFLYILHLYFIKKKNRLFCLPLLMLVWVNLHGGFLMGWALIIGVVGWKTVERIALEKSVPGLKHLWICLLAVSLSTLINPYGYRLLVFLYQTLSLPRAITEWAPVELWSFSYARFKIMAAIFLGTFVINFRWIEGWEAAAIGAILLAAFQQQRHIPFFSIAATPFIVHWLSIDLDAFRRRFPKSGLGRLSYIVIIFGILTISAHQAYRGIYIYVAAKCRIIVSPKDYPVSAVRFLKANEIKGNLLVPFSWGEYAIWHLYPACRVSIDGRFRTVYPESIINDHFIHEEDRAGWKRLMHRYPADIVLARQSRFFHDLIGRSQEWIYVYSDSTAIIFLKYNMKNKKFIELMRNGRVERQENEPSIYFP